MTTHARRIDKMGLEHRWGIRLADIKKKKI